MHLIVAFLAPTALELSSCSIPEAFVALDFNRASLVRSNLGGIGGRCATAAGQCEETQTESTPHEILIRHVAVDDALGSINLRITNQSECTQPHARLCANVRPCVRVPPCAPQSAALTTAVRLPRSRMECQLERHQKWRV